MATSSAATDATAAVDASSSETTNHASSGPKSSTLTQQNSAMNGSQTSKQSSASNSVSQSPAASRDGSPSRQVRRTASSTRLSSANRKNSQQDLSPTRQVRQGALQEQGAAARTLASTTTPNLRPSNREPSGHAATPQKTVLLLDLKENPRWPVSPRLRSPPPQLARPGASTQTRVQEVEAPTINIQRPSPSPQVSEVQLQLADNENDDSLAPSGMRTPVRGQLETVQEVSNNNSPSRSSDASLVDQVREKLVPRENNSDPILSDADRALKTKTLASKQSNGIETVPAKADTRRTSSVPAPPLVSRQSSAISAKHVKTKPDPGSTQSMTVETETVASIPQVALTTSTKDGGSGVLRAKPSTETIKPKKEKKKIVRKQPLVNSGAASKADNFEAKIASAVDEANTSDSEETFVYDSNPPDKAERSNRRFHSRTPSATSMVSQAERQNLRSIYGVMEGCGHGPVPKKSMKFVNTFNGNASDSLTPGDEDGKGSGRSAGGSTRGTVRHHHIGRWGRQPGNGHASLFDTESPFPNAAKSKLVPSNNNSRNPSGPPSPRSGLSTRGHLHTKRSSMQMSSSYDLDDTTGADDERTPLISTLRSSRGNRSRRGPHNLRQAESQTYTRRSSYLNRFAACLVLTVMLLLVITGAIGFMFATSQPMTDIDIVSIKNVVTSEQVLMFDLTVKAHNPNIVVVTIDHANLEIFAKSEFAGTGSDWRKHHRDPGAVPIPIDGPPRMFEPGETEDETRPNVLLGRITEFDSPLTFEGSLFHQGTSSSTGEMQLPNPGNGTSGGSERWERIYQNQFDLIVKGVVKYRLPLSAHIRSATVSGRTTVQPNSANDPSHKPNGTALGTP